MIEKLYLWFTLLVLLLFFLYRWNKNKKLKIYLKEVLTQNPLILDVRSEAEYNLKHYPLAVHIPLNQINQRLRELPEKNKTIVVYCASGSRSAMAVRILKAAGYKNVVNATSMSNLYH